MVSAAEKDMFADDDDDFFSKKAAAVVKAKETPAASKAPVGPKKEDVEPNRADDAIPPEEGASSAPAGKPAADGGEKPGEAATKPVRRAPRKVPQSQPKVEDKKNGTNGDETTGNKETEEPVAGKDAKEGEDKKGDGFKVVVKSPTKKVRLPMTPAAKMVNFMKNKSGKTQDLPTLDHLVRGHLGEMVAVKDVAIFSDEPEFEGLKEVWKACPLINRINLSSRIDPKQVKTRGAEIFSDDRMFTQVQVARIKEDGKLECTSGRHRLVFVALVYGPDAKIPMLVVDMGLNEARSAVRAANEARKINPMERTAYTVMTAVNGDIDAAQADVYTKTVTNKASAIKYAIYSLMYRQYPLAFGFDVSLRGEGGITTVNNIKDFLNLALDWDKSVTAEAFDKKMTMAVRFINSYVKKLLKEPAFDPKHQLGSKPLKAVGKYIREYDSVTKKSPVAIADSIVECMLALGEVGSHPALETHTKLSEAMQEKVA